jgi:hypothetical protein
MTKENQQFINNLLFCNNLLTTIKPDVEKAGFKTHKDMAILTFHESRGKRYFCEFRTFTADGKEFKYQEDIYASCKADARYQAWNNVLGKLGIGEYAK